MSGKVKYACYTQLAPERDVTGSSFSKGQINFRINNTSVSRWNPYRSYIRMRVRLETSTGNQLLTGSSVAPSMFQGHCFWAQLNASCQGCKVSEVDDYVPQIAALRNRYSVSEGRRSEFLSHTNFAQASYQERLHAVSANGFDPPNIELYEFTSLTADGVIFVLPNEEITLTNNVLTYEAVGGGADGAVDLTLTNISAGDSIYLFQQNNMGNSVEIERIEASTIYLKESLNDFPNENITFNTFMFTKSKPSLRTGTYELIFKPGIGLFTLDEFLPGNWVIELTPAGDINYKKYAVESNYAIAPVGAGGTDNYDIEILDMQFYVYKGNANSGTNGTKDYSFTEIRAQGQSVVNSVLTNKTFVCNPSSHTFTIAFQSADAGDVALYPKTKFIVENDQHLKLLRYSLRYNGHILPNPAPDIKHDIGLTFVSQQYYETLFHNGSIFLDDPEGLDKWLERGPYYSYKFPQERDSSNRLYITQQFSAYYGKKFILLVFDHYYKGFTLECENGLVRRCTRTLDVN